MCAHDCDRNRLRHAGGSAVLSNPQANSGGAWTRNAGRLQWRNARSGRGASEQGDSFRRPIGEAQESHVIPAGATSSQRHLRLAPEPPRSALPAAGGPGSGSAAPAGEELARPRQLPEGPCPANSSQIGIEEFYNDPMLMGLIHQAMANNRELKILDQEVQIAATRFWHGEGRTFPSSRSGPAAGWTNPASTRLMGAAESQTPYFPAATTFPIRCRIRCSA